MQRLSTALACVWILLAGTAPNVGRLGPISVRPEDIVVLVMLWPALVRLVQRGRLRAGAVLAAITLLSCSFGILGLAAVLSTSLSANGLPNTGTFGYDSTWEILKEAIRFAKYIVVIIAFGTVPRQGWKPIRLALATGCMVLVLVQVAQYAGVTILNDWIAATYAVRQADGVTQLGNATSGHYGWRSGSLMLNPNILGAYLTAPLFVFAMSFAKLVAGSTRPRSREYMGWGGVSLVTALGVFLTQSRTSVITAVVGLILCGVLTSRLVRLRLAPLIPAIVVGLLAVIVLGWTFRDSMNRMWYTWNPPAGSDVGDSLQIKAHLVLKGIDDLQGREVLFGKGPAMAPPTDSELGYIVTWYGFLGLLVYIAYYCGLLAICLKYIRDPSIRIAVMATLTAYAMGALTNSFLLSNMAYPTFLALFTVATKLPHSEANVQIGQCHRSKRKEELADVGPANKYERAVTA